MKRVVKKDGKGPFVTVGIDARMRPAGPTRLPPETKVFVEELGKSHRGAFRVRLRSELRPGIEEVWDDGPRVGDGLSPHDHLLCESVRATGSECAKLKDDLTDYWCDACLQVLPLDVDEPNKPWRGMTDDERKRLVASVARRERLHLTAVGERFLAVDVVLDSLCRFKSDLTGLRDRVEAYMQKVRPGSGTVQAPSVEDAVRFACPKFGTSPELILECSAKAYGVTSLWFVRFVR